MEAAVVVGIDVSKRTLEVALSSGEGFSVANNEDGISELLARLRPQRCRAGSAGSLRWI